MYIYKIQNLLNNKIYIGQSTRDIKESRDYFGSGIYINRAIEKYGKGNFIKQILFVCDNKMILDLSEKVYIALYKSKEKEIGYNIANGGEGNCGLKHSAETKKLISEKNKGNKNCLGRILSDETKRKMSVRKKEFLYLRNIKLNSVKCEKARRIQCMEKNILRLLKK